MIKIKKWFACNFIKLEVNIWLMHGLELLQQIFLIQIKTLGEINLFSGIYAETKAKSSLQLKL